jgi:hypothetical protein
MMHPTTRKKLTDIKNKVKSKVTNSKEFKDDDAVIEEAVNMYYDHLKKNKHL